MSERSSTNEPDDFSRPSVVTRVTSYTSNAVAVVEDDAVLREAICEVLRDAGLDPHGVATLPNARKLLGVVHPCAMVLDLRLDGDDASLLFSEMAREGVHLPVVIVSADRALLHRQPARQQTILLEKPFELDELVNAVLAVVVAE